jgi:hypothetical protein
VKKATILLLPMVLALSACSNTTNLSEIEPCVVQGLTFTPNPVQVEKNLTIQLNPTPRIGPKGCVGTPTIGTISNWSTNDGAKVRVDSQGRVQGLIETATSTNLVYIYAKISGKPGKVEIKVLPPTLLEGVVRDAVTQNPLQGVSLSFARSGQDVRSATTSGNGTYSSQVPAGTNYIININKPGYLPVQMNNIEATAYQSHFLDTIPLISTNYTGKGKVTGIITNSVSGKGLEGVTVNLRSGIGVQSGNTVASNQTDSSGTYLFNSLDTGYYTAEVVRSGFIPTFYNLASVGGLVTKDQNTSISPILADDQYRIILTWGDTPADLDSHLIGPDNLTGVPFHVYYASRGPYTFGDTGVQLDIDDRSSFGPETITIDKIGRGLYRYYIHDYTNRGSSSSNQLSNSSARIRVYNGNRVALDTNVPTGRAGIIWTVFEIENNVLRVVNQISAGFSVLTPASLESQNNFENYFFDSLPLK